MNDKQVNELFAEFEQNIATGMGLDPKEWVYRDMPWLDVRLWDKFMDIFGAENVKGLAMSSRGDLCRGQILVNTQARRNLKERRGELEALAKEVFKT